MSDYNTTRREVLGKAGAIGSAVLAGCGEQNTSSRNGSEKVLEEDSPNEELGLRLEETYSNDTAEIDRAADASGPITYEKGQMIVCDRTDQTNEGPTGIYLEEVRDGEVTLELRDHDC